MINVILADHQPIFRAGTARVLASEEDIRIVGQPGSSEQLMHAARRFRAHVTLLSADFLPQLPELKKIAMQAGIALMMLAEKGELASHYVGLGFQGVIFRSVDPKTVVAAVRRLSRGDSFVQDDCPTAPNLGMDVAGIRVCDQLTVTELRVIGGVMRGHKNREIAILMNSTEHSVKNSIRTIFNKLGISDRLELALYVMYHKPLAKVVAMHTSKTVLPTTTAKRALWA